MGAAIDLEHGYTRARNGLNGLIRLRCFTPGTENLNAGGDARRQRVTGLWGVSAGCSVVTLLTTASREPEIADLADA